MLFRSIASARILGIRSLEVVYQCRRVILAAAASLILGLLLRFTLVALDVPAAARLLLLIITFVPVYVALVLGAEPRLRDEARWFRGRT